MSRALNRLVDDVVKAHDAEIEEVAIACIAGGVSTSELRIVAYASKPLQRNMIVRSAVEIYSGGKLFHIEPITLVKGF